MASMTNEYLEGFRQALEGWTDQRFVTRDDIWALAMFSTYMVNLAEADGWEYCGHSLKMASPMCTLVVKARLEGIPHVVFSSGRDTISCIRAFLRKMEEGWLEWQVDKYRQ